MTNALTLGAQLTKAFNEIRARVNSAASASVNSGSISSKTRVYQAKFNSGDWSGELLAYKVVTEDPAPGAADQEPRRLNRRPRLECRGSDAGSGQAPDHHGG